MRNGCRRHVQRILGNAQENILPDGWVRLILSPPSPSARAFLPWDPWFWCASRDLFRSADDPGQALMTASGNSSKSRIGARVAQR